MPTIKIVTHEKNKKKTMIREFFLLFLFFTYKYDQIQLSKYLLLHDIVYPTCC